MLQALSTPVLTASASPRTFSKLQESSFIPPGRTHHFTGNEEADETFARFFPLRVEREENFQPLISKILILQLPQELWHSLNLIISRPFNV